MMRALLGHVGHVGPTLAAIAFAAAAISTIAWWLDRRNERRIISPMGDGIRGVDAVDGVDVQHDDDPPEVA
jgi:hypothetical protein